MPAAASASFSSISSVVSDFTFTTSVDAVRARDVDDDRVRLGGVARPVHLRRPPPVPRCSNCTRYSSRWASTSALIAAAGLAQLLPVGQLGDDARRAWRGSCRVAWRRFARSCAFASSRSRRGREARSRRVRRREDLGEVQRAHAAAPTREAAADLQQARAVDGACRPRRRSRRSRALVGEHRERRVGVLDRERAAEAAALVGAPAARRARARGRCGAAAAARRRRA